MTSRLLPLALGVAVFVPAATAQVGGNPDAFGIASAAHCQPVPADMMIEDCLNRAATQLDADLAAEVREWHQNIRSNYAGADGSAPTEPLLGMRNREITAATTAQQRWTQWRDAECDYVGLQGGGGSGSSETVAACSILLTEQRIAAVRASR